ncbi:hypothetical protein EDC94DRAFT_510068, partial [Helicostylum pulchrum]
IENTIAKIQKELVETKALRSGCKWRELGETSAGYLKQTVTARSIKKNITSLQHPDLNNQLCHQPSKLQSAVSPFYQQLYRPDPVDTTSVSALLQTIPLSDRIPVPKHQSITKDFTIDNIREGAN